LRRPGYYKEYYASNRERVLETHRQWEKRNPDQRRERVKQYQRKYPERLAVRMKRSRTKLRTEVIDAYGNKCNCCGESIIQFLTIDHVNGDGNKDRLASGRKRGGHALYSKLRREKYPKGYRVLCWNCNSGRHVNGGVCPHKEVN